MVYSVRADTEQIFGATNVSKWADLDNDEDSDNIASRITWAIGLAHAQINARLKGCRYTVPFTLVNSAYDEIIIDLSARLTGVLLYDNRKLVDIPEFDEVNAHREIVEATYRDIHGGRISLLVYTVNAVNYPQAIDSTA